MNEVQISTDYMGSSNGGNVSAIGGQLATWWQPRAFYDERDIRDVRHVDCGQSANDGTLTYRACYGTIKIVTLRSAELCGRYGRARRGGGCSG